MRGTLSRRAVLRYGALGLASLALAACQPKVVEVEKEVTKVVEKAVEKIVTATAAPKGIVPILFWFQAENHKPEYESRVQELNDKFEINFTFELMDRDAMNKKFPATLMAGSGFPDIIEMNADDTVKYLKGDDKQIAFLGLNEVLDTSPYYAQVLTSRWDRFTKDGTRYAAPHDVHPVIMLYHDAEWQKLGVDMSKVTTWDEYLEACSKVPKTMADGRPRYAVMDCLSCTHLPGRMLEKGLWWTDKAGEPMLTHPDFKVCVQDWLRFKPFWVDIDWGNQVAMIKEGQVMSQLCPDWLYGIHKQGTAADTAWLAQSPMRLTRMPDFVASGPRVGTWGGTGCSIPKLAKEQALSTEVMLYMYFENGKAELEKRYKDTGILPPVSTSWAGKGFHEAEPYVGGQVAAEVFIEAAKSLPSYSENWKTTLVSGAWGEQFSLLWEGKIGVDEAIQKADESARDMITKAE